MDLLLTRIERAALLHDIGKLVLRANPARQTHSAAGVEFLRRFAEPEDADILRAVGHHHAADLRSAHLAVDDFSYIIYEADNLASGSDRRKNEGEAAGFSRSEPLHNIFETFGESGQGEAGTFHLQGLLADERLEFPHPRTEVKASADAYQELYQHLEANVQRCSPFKMEIHELMRVLEGILSYVPSSTALDEVADISLYDHLRLTAAYAAVLFGYLQQSNISDYHEALFLKPQKLRETETALLVSGDLSGIQQFIYTIPSKGALKSLRGRSFYLEILMENIADEILARLGLNRTSLLYTGGGHFYLLLAKTAETEQALAEAREQINDWLLAHFGMRLYLALAWTPCRTLDFLAEGNTRAVFQGCSHELGAQKLSRYSEAQLARLFSPESDEMGQLAAGRECRICHTSTLALVPYGEDGGEACPLCANLYTFGERILSRDVFCVTEQEEPDALPVPGLGRELFLTALSEKEAEAQPDFVRLYVKNKMLTGKQLMTTLWLGDYTAREQKAVLSFEELSQRSGGSPEALGIKRLGVLRADVDNLGAAFLAGFAPQYATLSRMAALSRALSLFFKRYMNELCAGRLSDAYEGEVRAFSLFGREKKAARDVHIVYSGGDDLFLVGAWDDLLELSVDIYRAFQRFTAGRLTFSAGLGLFAAKTPVSEMARQVGELEDVAKSHPGKNSIALFGTAVGTETEAYCWPDFIDKVCGEKLAFLQSEFASPSQPVKEKIILGKSAAYRLLSLLTAGGEGVNLARFAYVLARMDPGRKSAAYPAYERVRQQLYPWYRSAEDRRQLTTALELLIYSIREKG